MKSKPNTILTHSISDLNIDHQKTFEAVMTATRTSTSILLKIFILLKFHLVQIGLNF